MPSLQVSSFIITGVVLWFKGPYMMPYTLDCTLYCTTEAQSAQ